MRLTRAQLHALAQIGAKVRIEQIQQEMQQLSTLVTPRSSAYLHTIKPKMVKARPRRSWSKQQRREVARRMKAYWASRRRTQLKRVS